MVNLKLRSDATAQGPRLSKSRISLDSASNLYVYYPSDSIYYTTDTTDTIKYTVTPAFSSWLSAVMALWKCLLGCLFLASALNNGDAQPLPESVYEQLTAQQLRELELGQNPELLELAARTGERIVVDMANAEQGAAVQAGVNAVLDCTSWLQNFPGGTVTWYRFRYLDLEFTMLGPEELQDRRVLMGLRRIEGDYNEIYNITRVRIQAGEEDPHAGQYRCEVCVGGPPGSPFRVCHNATTSLLTIGRPPILNDATGRSEYNTKMGLSMF